MLFDVLLILGVAVLSIALRTCQSMMLQKLGVFGVLATSFLIGWRFTDNVWVGVFCGASWLMLPWLEILTRVRKTTVPLEKNLRHKAPPTNERFPMLRELTDEVEDERFAEVDDCGWEWQEHQQFFRLFYKADERTQAAVCFIDQNEIAFYYLSLSSRGKDGRIWTTWNYPFSYSLKLAPQWQVNRLRGDRSFFQLIDSHRDFLRRNGVGVDDLADLEPETIQTEIQNDLRAQVTHNLAVGVLVQTPSGDVRYSWRGLFFLWVQFLRDFVRLG